MMLDARYRVFRSLLGLGLLTVTMGCFAPSYHMVEPGGNPLRELDYLWLEVDRIFPGGLPSKVTIQEVEGDNASFVIETSTVGIPRGLKVRERRGEIIRQLTHLALNRLSGGDEETRGRCFDDDVSFLRQAVACYLYRMKAEQEDLVNEAYRVAAMEASADRLSPLMVRDWEAFYWRGLWSDRSREWNQEGLKALVSLGDYIERNYGLTRLAPVFTALAEEYSLDGAMRERMGVELETLLKEWLAEARDRHPDKPDANSEKPETDTAVLGDDGALR